MKILTRRRLVVLVAVAVIGAAVAVGSQVVPGLFPGDQVPTVTIEKQRFQRRVTAEGILKAVKATPLVAPPEAQGRLKIAWSSPDGSRVEAGQVVMRFDSTDFEKQLKDSEADRTTATTKIAKERVQLDAVLRGRDRSAQLAEAELDRTRKFQRKDSEIFSRNQIVESEIDERLSTARKDHAGEVRKIESRVSRSKLELLAIEQRSAQLAVDQATQALKSLELVAPHAGIVVFQRDWRGNLPRAGDMVWAGQKVAELPLLDEMEAEVFVLEADAGGLEDGIAATVLIEARPGATYHGKIRRVDKLAKPRQRGVPIQYFGVTLELDHTDKEVMKPGQRVRATLVLDDQEAVVVPRQAVFDKDGKQLVYRLVSGEFEPVAVELGASSPGRVVVKSGLAEGDQIALRDPTRPVDQLLSKDEEETPGGHRGPSVQEQ